MRIKMFSGPKKCISGEKYKFKNGIAEVPDFRIGGEKVFINIAEFNLINKEIERNIIT